MSATLKDVFLVSVLFLLQALGAEAVYCSDGTTYCSYSCCGSYFNYYCCYSSYSYSSYSSSLSYGAIAGAVIGSVVGLGLLICCIVGIVIACQKPTRVVNPAPVAYNGNIAVISHSSTVAGSSGYSYPTPAAPYPAANQGQGPALYPPPGQVPVPPPYKGQPPSTAPPPYQYNDPAYPPGVPMTYPPPATPSPFAAAASGNHPPPAPQP